MLITFPTTATATMTSREMANLTEKRHDSVKRTIDTLAASGVITLPQIVEVSNAGAGPSTIVEYLIGQRDSYIIVAQLSPEFTARIVDRWQDLEATAASAVMLPDFTNPAAAARAWADQVEARQALQIKLEVAAPAVEFVEKFVDSTGTKSFRATCKLLGVKETVFRAFLIEKRIVYRLGGAWAPFSQHLDAGRLVVKAGTSDASGHAYNSTRFTPKGLEWIAGEFAKHQLEQRL